MPPMMWMGKRCRTDPTPSRGRRVRGPSGYVSVGQRLIELLLGEGQMARRVRAIYDQILNQWGLLVPPPQ